MITEAILSAFLLVPQIAINLLPEVPAVMPDSVINGANVALYGIGWVLPVSELLPILIISLAVDNFKIIMAVVVRIKSFIPAMGN
jgi:hypothetical protein